MQADAFFMETAFTTALPPTAAAKISTIRVSKPKFSLDEFAAINCRCCRPLLDFKNKQPSFFRPWAFAGTREIKDGQVEKLELESSKSDKRPTMPQQH
jgi:hypothetical protein